MPKYTVRIPIPAEHIVRGIEADDPDQAIEQIDGIVPTLCSSCAADFYHEEADFEGATAEVES